MNVTGSVIVWSSLPAHLLLVHAALLGVPAPLMVAFFGVLILGVAAMARTGSRVPTAPVWVYLGEVSFSIYMVCLPWELLFGQGVAKLKSFLARH